MADWSALLLGWLDREAHDRRGGGPTAADGGALTWRGHAALLAQSLDNPAGCPHAPAGATTTTTIQNHPIYTLDGTQTVALALWLAAYYLVSQQLLRALDGVPLPLLPISLGGAWSPRRGIDAARGSAHRA